MATAVQIPRLPIGAGEGPFVLVAPLVDAHDEEAQWGFIQHAIILTLEPIVEPLQLQRIEIRHGRRAKVDLAHACRCTQRMGPRPDDELALARRCRAAVLPHSVEVVEDIGRPQVIPVTHVEGRYGDVAPLLLYILSDSQ